MTAVQCKALIMVVSRFATVEIAVEELKPEVVGVILDGENPEESNFLRDLLQKRNSSILAHGLKPIGETSAKRFLEYVGSMVDEPETRTAAEHIRLREL